MGWSWCCPVIVEGDRHSKRSKKMPKTHPRYPNKYRQQIPQLTRARTPEKSRSWFVQESETVPCKSSNSWVRTRQSVSWNDVSCLGSFEQRLFHSYAHRKVNVCVNGSVRSRRSRRAPMVFHAFKLSWRMKVWMWNAKGACLMPAVNFERRQPPQSSDTTQPMTSARPKHARLFCFHRRLVQSVSMALSHWLSFTQSVRSAECSYPIIRKLPCLYWRGVAPHWPYPPGLGWTEMLKRYSHTT